MRGTPPHLTNSRLPAELSQARTWLQRERRHVPADGGQNRLCKACPAVGYGVADRRIIVDVTGHDFLSDRSPSAAEGNLPRIGGRSDPKSLHSVYTARLPKGCIPKIARKSLILLVAGA
jgi:hypothetical protein